MAGKKEIVVENQDERRSQERTPQPTLVDGERGGSVESCASNGLRVTSDGVGQTYVGFSVVCRKTFLCLMFYFVYRILSVVSDFEDFDVLEDCTHLRDVGYSMLNGYVKDSMDKSDNVERPSPFNKIERPRHSTKVERSRPFTIVERPRPFNVVMTVMFSV